jgi:hypothetical protein
MLILCVLAQFIGFAIMWWTPQPYEGMRPQWRAAPSPIQKAWEAFIAAQKATATAPTPGTTVDKTPTADEFFPTTEQTRALNVRKQWNGAYTMAVPVTQLASLIGVSSQAIIVFVTLLVMLVAQAPGVSHITRALIWSVLLLFMFLPWQYFARDFPIPGIIYSYVELLRIIGPSIVGEKVQPYETWLIYGRFIVWPALGMLALLITAERFRAGVMIAIGHPLQSILQPRGTNPAGGNPPQLLGRPVVKPRPIAPVKPMGR